MQTAASAEAAVPGRQTVQDAEPEAETEPMSQGTHAVAFADDMVPGWHMEAVAAPGALTIDPSGGARHADIPCAAASLPAAHLVQIVESGLSE